MFGRSPLSSAPIAGVREGGGDTGQQARVRARDESGPAIVVVDHSQGEP